MAMGERVREAMQDAQLGTSQSEDRVTKMVESQTGAVPSIAFLGMAVGAMVMSLSLMMAGRREAANFIGQWAPTILIMGLYNKLVKQHGSDRYERAA
jgi:hypothetical protein